MNFFIQCSAEQEKNGIKIEENEFFVKGKKELEQGKKTEEVFFHIYQLPESKESLVTCEKTGEQAPVKDSKLVVGLVSVVGGAFVGVVVPSSSKENEEETAPAA